jgi:hypothetical protein
VQKGYKAGSTLVNNKNNNQHNGVIIQFRDQNYKSEVIDSRNFYENQICYTLKINAVNNNNNNDHNMETNNFRKIDENNNGSNIVYKKNKFKSNFNVDNSKISQFLFSYALITVVCIKSNSNLDHCINFFDTDNLNNNNSFIKKLEIIHHNKYKVDYNNNDFDQEIFLYLFENII